jgi:hypothetical protein
MGKKGLQIGDAVRIHKWVKGVGGLEGTIVRNSSHENYDFVIQIGQDSVASLSVKREELERVRP